MEKPIRVSSDFVIVEFVSRNIFARYGNLSTRFINPWCVRVAQQIRDRFDKPVTINNWYWGGPFQYSGFREAECEEGALNSPHKRGQAIDLRVKGVDYQEVRKELKDNYREYRIGLLEEGNSGWNHASNEWFISEKLAIYDLKENRFYFK